LTIENPSRNITASVVHYIKPSSQTQRNLYPENEQKRNYILSIWTKHGHTDTSTPIIIWKIDVKILRNWLQRDYRRRRRCWREEKCGDRKELRFGEMNRKNGVWIWHVTTYFQVFTHHKQNKTSTLYFHPPTYYCSCYQIPPNYYSFFFPFLNLYIWIRWDHQIISQLSERNINYFYTYSLIYILSLMFQDLA